MSETKRDDGGPAFPIPANLDLQGGPNSYWSDHPSPGMTLRDYFAAHATFSDIERVIKYCKVRGNGIIEQHACARYIHADSMIAERNKP